MTEITFPQEPIKQQNRVPSPPNNGNQFKESFQKTGIERKIKTFFKKIRGIFSANQNLEKTKYNLVPAQKETTESFELADSNNELLQRLFTGEMNDLEKKALTFLTSLDISFVLTYLFLSAKEAGIIDYESLQAYYSVVIPAFFLLARGVITITTLESFNDNPALGKKVLYMPAYLFKKVDDLISYYEENMNNY